MANFFKKFGHGILYVITFPIFLVILVIFAIYGLFLLIVQFFKMIFNFFTGRSVHGELPEDVEARKILNKDDAASQINNNQEQQNPAPQDNTPAPTPAPTPAQEQTPTPTPAPTPAPTQEQTIESVAFDNPATPTQGANNQQAQNNDNVIQDFLSSTEPANNQSPIQNNTPQEETIEVYRPKTNDNYEIMDDDADDDFDVTIS